MDYGTLFEQPNEFVLTFYLEMPLKRDTKNGKNSRKWRKDTILVWIDQIVICYPTLSLQPQLQATPLWSMRVLSQAS